VQSLREHLDSPQFPDEDPPTKEELAKPGLSMLKFSGGWVAAGQPRWRAYAIFLASIIGGALLALPLPGDSSLFLIFGLGFVVFGVFGAVETARGKRFPRP
jgi:hypothetical protein